MKYRLTKTLIVASGLLLATPSAFAGQVYGTVEGTNGPVRNGTVRIDCPGADPGRRNTDDYGSYSVYVDASGKCKIWVNDIGPISVRVYIDDVRYDLRLTGEKLERR